MEITVRDYGAAIFNAMTEANSHLAHWESIRAKAEPLVWELIRLNQEMCDKNGIKSPYQLVGRCEPEKVALSNQQKIEIAQIKLWGVKAGVLIPDKDKVWLLDNDDVEMYVGQDDPATVEFVKEEFVYVECKHPSTIVRVHANQTVLRAPEDWDENEELYSSRDYWLEKAKELGIQ